ncbi:protein phosphatase [Enterococcus sp. JM4C]|uniref:Stp1/IreP family PP2C-type Ser/Thr phosphatase n=1 Tax=Candidatus Enterococcus huntleyi TaxID=1857217 RepID=UPI00137A37D4|nr:Stp1/IreP family PP2C-type Ser/Thr phosphatase [Enterococcus sp. JM4C]KAF1295241.1 protein phosphatase [Enterococcus sp. JM4C]
MNIYFQSDVGRRRNSNQDYANLFKNKEGIQLAILADGMGGHLAGDVASKMAVNDLGSAWEETEILNEEKAAQWFIQQLQIENERIYEKGQSMPEYNGMGTTIVAVAIFERDFVIANVGDSRAYLLRSQKILQLTEDHSLVNELVKSGEISREMAANHPRKNVLTRSVGMPGLLEVDVTNQEWLAGDYVLVCSDGLTNMVSEEEIQAIIKGPESLEQKVNQLIEQANAAGGADNITVLIIQCEEEDVCLKSVES